MSERPSFVEALRQLDDRNQAERLRPGAAHRIARRLDAELLQAELPSRRRTWVPMLSFAAGAAMVLAVFTLSTEPTTVERKAEEPAPAHASWVVGGDNCHAISGKTALVLDGRCRVEPPDLGVVIESRETTQLQAAKGGVALLDGTALFEVTPILHGPPRRVEVPGGAIEVIGTRFSVVVVGDAGHVDLLEGSIRFVADTGQVHHIEPGERFYFSASPEVVARVPQPTELPETLEPLDELASGAMAYDPAPFTPLAAGERLAELERLQREAELERKASKTRAGRGESPDVAAIVDRVAELRTLRKYTAAVELLEKTLQGRLDRHTREVLSYELGTILSSQLPDRERACAHWAHHRTQFPDGKYAARAIERAEQRLRCNE